MMPQFPLKAGSDQVMQVVSEIIPSCQMWYSAGAPAAATLAFCLLTLLHVVANIQAMRALQLQSINPHRLQMLLRTFLAEVKLCSVPSTGMPLFADALLNILHCPSVLQVVGSLPKQAEEHDVLSIAGWLLLVWGVNSDLELHVTICTCRDHLLVGILHFMLHDPIIEPEARKQRPGLGDLRPPCGVLRLKVTDNWGNKITPNLIDRSCGVVGSENLCWGNMLTHPASILLTDAAQS